MMLWLQWLTFAVSLALQIFVIASLRRGAYKEYPFVLIYCIVSLVTIVADAMVISDLVSMSVAQQRVFFYRNAALRQFLLFTVIVSLIDRAMMGKPYRARLRIFLMLAVFGSIVSSYYIHSDTSRFSLLMTKITRDLMFGSVGLTLLLWSTLIASKKKDDQLLMITGGLGLQFTLEAIGQSMRQLSQHRPYVLVAGNVILSVAHLMRLYVWREAFRRPTKLEETKKKLGGISEEDSRQAQTVLGSNLR